VALAFGDFVFDPEQRELRRDGVLLKVDAKLLQLLACFLENPGRLLSKRELLDRVWDGRAVADNVLSVNVAKLRQVLGRKPGERDLIENSYGRGYRFMTEVRVLDAPAAPRKSTLQTDAGPGAPLVGRALPLQRVAAALQRAAAGQGGLCVLSGEPGIGKTRLATAADERARADGMKVVWGRCQAADGTPPLGPFIQVLRELQADGGIDASSLLGAQGLVERERAEPAAMLGRSASGLGAGHGLIDAVAQQLLAAADKTPLVLIIDDVQWADAASLKLLHYLVAEIPRRALLVLLTQRASASPDARIERELARLYAHPHCEQLHLERLQSKDVDEYLQSQFGSVDAALSRAVFERSEGNPFFMVELVRPWLGVAQPLPEQLQVPRAALELMRERLQSLPALSRDVLSAAAVIGQTFDLGLLSHVTERPAHELLEALDDSLANDTIVPAAESAGAYAFDHALIREVLYDELPLPKRCWLHRRAGEGLMRRRDAGGDVTRAELAHHFLSALPRGNVALAVSHAREAAASATIMCAHEDARALLRRALASLRFTIAYDPEVRTALLLELAIVERALADPAYHEHLQQGVALARSLRLGSMLTLAGRFLSPGPGVLSRPDTHKLLTAAAEVLPADADGQRALVLAQLTWTPPSCWSAKQVKELLTQAKQLAERSGDSEAAAAVRDAELYFTGCPAQRERADALAREIDRESQRNPQRVNLWRTLYTRMYRYISASVRGDHVAVQAAVDEMTALHTKLNIAEFYWHHERLLLIQRMSRAQWRGVDGELERLRERARRLGFQAWRAISACDYAWFLLNTGDPGAFARMMRPDLEPVSHDSPNTRSIKLRSLAEHGFLEDAHAGLSELTAEVLRDLPHDRDLLSVLADLSVVAVAVGSVQHCQVLYERLRPYADYYAMGMSLHFQGSLSHYLGNLARTLGQPQTALAHLTHGIEQNRRAGLITWLIHNQLDLAKLLLASGPVQDRLRAHQLLGSLAERAGELGMQPLRQSALQLMASD